MSYVFVEHTLRQMPPGTLPIGLPHAGEIHKNFKVKGLTSRARRQVAKIMGKTPVNAYALGQVILEECVEVLGPYQQKDFPPKILDHLSAIDREYLCWMAVLNNYQPPYDDLLVRSIDFQCERCGHYDTGILDPWDLKVVNVDPKSWDLQGSQIRYEFLHQGTKYWATLVNGRIENSIATEQGELEDRMAKLLPQLIVANEQGMPQPFTFEDLERRDFIFTDTLYEALTLRPLPGVDPILRFVCPKCKHVQREVFSYLPFLSSGSAARRD